MRNLLRAPILVVVLLAAVAAAQADEMAPRVLIAREGAGYLERVGPQLVLHLKGTPEEMGRQHGVLLRQHVRDNLAGLAKKAKDAPLGAMTSLLLDGIWKMQSQYLPPRYAAELRALADAAGLSYEQVRQANTVPEMFHCSGFALFGKATADGALYHGRILDYGVDMGLQEHSVVTIAEPVGLIPFVNVGYAGFTGSVTGFNLEGVAFGEMGGGGSGKWDGTPMSFLMRRGLEEAHTLADARKLFSDSKRTCEYYYVISDCKGPDAVGVRATPEEIDFVGPNEAKAPLTRPIKDAVVLSADERYTLLTQRIEEKWGKLDAAGCRELMHRPVAMKSCLHAVLMAPKTAELWVANATPAGEPASEQPYTYLNVPELMAAPPGGGQ